MGPFPFRFLSAFLNPWAWRMAWRDSRSQRGRLALYSLSIAAGICSLTTIHALKRSIQEGIAAQAKSLLGTDVLVSSRRPIPDERIGSLAALLKENARETAFSSMLQVPASGRTRVVQVRALEGGYPFGTQVETQPAGAWEMLQNHSGILLAPSLMSELGVSRGDHLKLGALELPVLGTVVKGVPRSSRFSGFAPEVFIRRGDLAATGLAGEQSLVYQHAALELKAQTEATRQSALVEIRRILSDNGVQIQTPEDRREIVAEGLNKAREFLGITALASLVLGGIGVAGAIHTHIRKRLPTVAILLCLGCPTQLATSVYLIQACVLGLLGACLGTLAGALAHAGAVRLAAANLPVSIQPIPDPLVLLNTGAVGLVLCCAFALLPLLKIREVPPSATLSARPEKHPKIGLQQVVICGFVLLLVWMVARLNGSTPVRASALSMGLVGAFSLLAATAWSLTVFARKILRPNWPYILRQGISNLFRPQNQTLLILLSLGLGVFLMLSTWLTKNLILNQLRMDPNGSSPNLYIIDVQPDQTAVLGELLKSQNLPLLEDAPMVTMRIESVKGLPLSALEAGDTERGRQPLDSEASRPTQRVPRWVMEREYRSTYRNTLNGTETVVAGAWPPGEIEAGGPVPLSLEQQLARDLRVGIGDEIVLDVQGVPVKTRVSCLRKVDWSQFNLNFFMIFPTGVLEDAPQFHLLTTRVPNEQRSGELQRALVRTAPNVSAVDLTSVLATVGEQLQKAARIIQLLAFFTLLTGFPILAAALLNGREPRIRETVLLRTLGASEWQVRSIIFIEYAALGLLSGLTGILLALAAYWAEAHWIFKTEVQLELAPLIVTLALTFAGASASGSLLTRGICRHSPLGILRQD